MPDLEAKAQDAYEYRSESPPDSASEVADVFGDEEEHEIKYKTLSWQVRFFARSAICAFLSMRSTVRQRPYDCGDCEQWNAYSTECHGRCGLVHPRPQKLTTECI